MIDTAVKPGDVLVVRSDGWAAWWIRFGAAIANKPNLSNHVAVAHHYDAKGTLWVIEGRPGGVGWRAANDYLKSRWTLCNEDQPKTTLQRAGVCDTMEALLKTDYDWPAIVADGANDLHIDWAPTWGSNNQVPGHVVCSSLACYAYDKNHLKRPPGNIRTDQPADWDTFILNRAWQ